MSKSKSELYLSQPVDRSSLKESKIEKIKWPKMMYGVCQSDKASDGVYYMYVYFPETDRFVLRRNIPIRIDGIPSFDTIIFENEFMEEKEAKDFAQRDYEELKTQSSSFHVG